VRWNLEQLTLFVRIAEGQSFSAAARELQRAQSAVSNAIALLEADLGMPLFERSSGRQPRLTDAGRVLLEDAREILRQCQRLEARAQGLLRGEEATLRLAQDEAVPFSPVHDSLEALAQQFPLLEVQLASGAQGVVARMLLERRADLGLLFQHERIPAALERQRLGNIDMVTVCGVGHPLAAVSVVGRRELARHRQLLMTAHDSHYPGGEQISPALWRADSFYSMAELLMRNLGWAWLPRHVLQYPAYQQNLCELPSDCTPPPLVVELVWRRDQPLGPAARCLAECFSRHLQALG
jgi:DNA-binding transcriptional LysR family regulator